MERCRVPEGCGLGPTSGAARPALDSADPSKDRVDALRIDIDGIEQARESGGRLAPRIRESLGRLEASDLPEVLNKARSCRGR